MYKYVTLCMSHCVGVQGVKLYSTWQIAWYTLIVARLVMPPSLVYVYLTTAIQMCSEFTFGEAVF